MDGDLFWRDLDAHEAAHDAALAEDELYPFPPPSGGGIRRREDTQAMKDALALVAAGGRASRYAYQCAGGVDPHLHRRIFQWVMQATHGDVLK